MRIFRCIRYAAVAILLVGTDAADGGGGYLAPQRIAATPEHAAAPGCSAGNVGLAASAAGPPTSCRSPATHFPSLYSLLSFACLLFASQLLLTQMLVRRHSAAARLAERRRIAMELHDTLIQGAQGLSLLIEGIARELPESGSTRRQLGTALDYADSLLKEARDSINVLNAPPAGGDLISSLSNTAKQLLTSSPAVFEVTTDGAPHMLAEPAREAVHRIAREAMTNALRHAGAKTIRVNVSYRRRHLLVQICDDGCGIDPDLLERERRGNHFGISGIFARARVLRAGVDIKSRAGGGTELILKVPAAMAYHERAIRRYMKPALRRLHRITTARKSDSLAALRQVGDLAE